MEEKNHNSELQIWIHSCYSSAIYSLETKKLKSDKVDINHANLSNGIRNTLNNSCVRELGYINHTQVIKIPN